MKAREKRRFGNRLKAARLAEDLSKKTLAGLIGCEPPSISQWENGEHYPNPAYLKHLKKRYPGLRETAGGTAHQECANTKPDFNLASTFRIEMSRVIGEPIDGLSPELWRPKLGGRSLVEALEVCEATIARVKDCSSGLEFISAREVLRDIVRLGEVGIGENVRGAGHVLFDAADEAVRCGTFFEVIPQLLERTHPFATAMFSTAAAENDPILKARAFGRYADVLGICGRLDPEYNKQALAMFRRGLELEQDATRKIGIHMQRAPLMVLARLDATDREFERAARAAEEAAEDNSMSVQQQARLLDGLCQAFASRYRRTRSKVAGSRASNFMELAQARHRVAQSKKVHVEYDLRSQKLSLVLARSGLTDHLPKGGRLIDRMRAMAEDLLRQGGLTGSRALVQEMTEFLRGTGPLTTKGT